MLFRSYYGGMPKLNLKNPEVEKYINSAKGFSEDSLVWMLRRVAEIDLAIKEGRVEEWNALEQYVAECIYRSHK